MEAYTCKLNLPESMVFSDFPLLPPDLRTRSASDPMLFADDLNQHYKNMISVSERILEALKQRRPAGLLRYLKYTLQTSVDQVIDNGRLQGAKLRGSGQPLDSLATRLKGKYGRMRLNMLGKRVDYSARTVIVVNPALRLDQCGMPFAVARKLFAGFLEAEVLKTQPPRVSPRSQITADFDALAKEEQWQMLRRVMEDRCVMLNRAPTLHRLSVQAFRPLLVDGEALHIHPLVCAPFNADFDGDTMTMHLALSSEAQEELHNLMMPTRNLLSPASGDPVIGPTQDMVLGIYYLTMPSIRAGNSGLTPALECSSVEVLLETVEECARGELSHEAVLRVPVRVLAEVAPEAVADDGELSKTEDGELAEASGRVVQTTAGRCLFFLLVHSSFRVREREHDLTLSRVEAAPPSLESLVGA